MNHKRISLVLVVVCVATMLVGSLAYFTDRVDASVVATAGTLELELSNLSTSKTSDFKPGEGIDVDFTLTNKGNKSTDVIETLVISSSALLTDNTDGVAEFDLYHAADVDLVDGYATVKDGKEPLAARSSGGTYTADKDEDGAEETYYTIKYVLPEFILSGTGLGAEVELDSESNAYGNAKVSDYVLVFRPDASNDFQGVTVLIDYEAQAKQHRNTDATTWDSLRTEISFAGDATHQSVPDKNP